jgi:hypothetical protein
LLNSQRSIGFNLRKAMPRGEAGRSLEPDCRFKITPVKPISSRNH